METDIQDSTFLRLEIEDIEVVTVEEFRGHEDPYRQYQNRGNQYRHAEILRVIIEDTGTGQMDIEVGIVTTDIADM